MEDTGNEMGKRGKLGRGKEKDVLF